MHSVTGGAAGWASLVPLPAQEIDIPSWFATTASVLAGGALTMIAAWLGDLRIVQREREKRREERHDRLVTKRNEFQRETLLALQVASQKLLRNTGASLQEDVVAHRSTGRWQRQQLPETLSDDHLRLTTELILLGSRVRDEEVRALADRLRQQAAVVGLSGSEQEAEARMVATADTTGSLIRRVGEIVRGLDEPD